MAQPDPGELLAWKNAEIEEIRGRIAALEADAQAIESLDAELVIPPEALSAHFALNTADFASTAAVTAYVEELEAARAGLEVAVHERKAVEAVLEAAWGAGATMPGAPAAPAADELALHAARLEHAVLTRVELERQVALVAARQGYLERSQPARERASQDDVLARQLAEERRRADEERRAAEAARARALTEKRQASSVAESHLRAEAARLEGVTAEQAEFRALLLELRKAQGEAEQRMESLMRALDAEPDPGARYARATAELAAVLDEALGVVPSWWRPTRRAPRPAARLAAEVRVLPDDFAADKAALEAQRTALHRAAAQLDREHEQVMAARAALLYEQAALLGRVRADLFVQLGARQREQRAALRSDDVRIDAAHVAVELMHWLDRRTAQLRDVPALASDWSVVGAALWWLIEIPLVLLFLRVALRRWDDWMIRAVDAAGTSVHLGGWWLLLARLADFARSFGPALLVLFTVVALYRQLGGARAPAEIQVLYVLLFWTAAFLAQLRLFERLARHVGTRPVERRSDAEGELADDTDDEDAAMARAEPPRAPDAPAAWALLVRTWRVATGFVAVVVILRELILLALGPVALHHLAGRLAWWGLVPLGVHSLLTWRPWIVREYVRRSAENSVLSNLAMRHSQRFYGALIVAVALIVVLVRQVGGFVRRNLSDLDATRRLLAFLFRRRVEKHAHEHGRVLTTTRELPLEIEEQFPRGPLDPDDRPVKPAFLDDIKAAFTVWQRDRVEGSVVVVGGTGMGKSTALRLLEPTLGEPVTIIKPVDKHTRPAELMATLARSLDLPDTPDTEAELVDAIERQAAECGSRVIAIDDGHNLFLRRVGGFAAWDAFKRIVNGTGDCVFWVVSFNEVAWDYLSNIAGGVSYFRRVFRIAPWSDEELRRLILTRMRRAGYRPSFMDLVVTRLEGVKASAQIIRTSQGYFRLLWDFTDGNPRLACHFWLRSLVPDVERSRVRVHLFAAPRIETLEKLPDNIAFVLAAVVEHENITSDELSMVTNLPVELCRFALQYCREHGYMWRNHETGRTKLSTHWQQSIIRYLKRRHLLYT